MTRPLRPQPIVRTAPVVSRQPQQCTGYRPRRPRHPCRCCAEGLLTLLDEPHSINISSYYQKVTLERPGCGARGRSCDFLQLPNPYSSMWLLSRERLLHASPRHSGGARAGPNAPFTDVAACACTAVFVSQSLPLPTSISKIQLTRRLCGPVKSTAGAALQDHAGLAELVLQSQPL